MIQPLQQLPIKAPPRSLMVRLKLQRQARQQWRLKIDLRKLFSAITTNLTAPFLVMRPTTAAWLASLDGTLGYRPFPAVGVSGGNIWARRHRSANTPADANSPSEHIIVLIDAAEIMLAEGSIEIKTTGQATVEMSERRPTVRQPRQPRWCRSGRAT